MPSTAPSHEFVVTGADTTAPAAVPRDPSTQSSSESSKQSTRKPPPGVANGGKKPPSPYSSLKKHSAAHSEFELVLVSLKEAALDTPAFRAWMYYLDTCVARTENWMAALTRSFLKVPQKLEEFSSIFSILDHLVPNFLQHSLVDHEYTLPLLQNSKEGTHKLWTMALEVFAIRSSRVEHIRLELLRRAERYKSVRREMLACQDDYDKFYQIHMAIPKTKDPGLLLEDLLQLAEVRKHYLRLSLDMVVEYHRLADFVNRSVILLNGDFWGNRLDKLVLTGFFSDFINDVSKESRRIKCWADSYLQAIASLSDDLLLARKNIEELTLLSMAPLMNLNDHNAMLINQRMLNDTTETSVEKAGYVFLKTLTEKSSKPIWVKRWAYVQNGVLGFLVISPSLRSVQESDKIGVLLCNVKYTPNEERLFCFEIKTSSATIVLQAETLKDLKSWLKVFDNARRAIVDTNNVMHSLLPVASSRFPPLVLEFRSTQMTSMDRSLTTSKTVDYNGNTIVSKKLSTNIEKNDALFLQYIIPHIDLIRLPIFTEASKSALLAGFLNTDPQIPSAYDANIYGSFGVKVATLPVSGGHHFEASGDPQLLYTNQLGNGIFYPQNFPNLWIAKDLQFRALFKPAIEPGEACLVSYDCLFAPNEHQELRATHFVTQRNVYSYFMSLGFVSLNKVPLSRFAEASCTPMKDYDALRLTLVQGELIIKLYLEDGALVEKKLNLLYRNIASTASLNVVELIDKLLELDHVEKEENEMRLKLAREQAKLPIPSHFDFVSLAAFQKTKFDFESVHFTQKLPYLTKRTVNLPPQAIFHIFCGSESALLNNLNLYSDMNYSDRNLWAHSSETGNYLMRDNYASYVEGGTGLVRVRQIIEYCIDNEFYSFKTEKGTIKLSHGPHIRFYNRVTVLKLEGERSVMRFYCDAEIAGKLIFNCVIQRLCLVINQRYAKLIVREIDLAAKLIGNRGKILRAVHLYGKVLVAEEPFVPGEATTAIVSRRRIIFIYLRYLITTSVKAVLGFAHFLLNILWLFIRNLGMHGFLLGVIIMLSFSNILLGAVGAKNYWNSRHSRHLIKDLVTAEPLRIQRAIYLKDIQDYVQQKLAISNASECFNMFQSKSVVLNYDKIMNWSNDYVAQFSGEKAAALKESLLDIAVRRNELLVSLSMLNKLEEELAKSEWRVWLNQEMAVCDQMRHFAFDADNSKFAMETLSEYCHSCSEEYSALKGII